MAKMKNTASNNAASQLGRQGGKVGGPARAKKLSSLERSSIAKEGGKAKANAIKKNKR